MVSSAYGGEWHMRIFADQITGTDHVVLSKGDITTAEPVLVRTHALNALEDVLGLGPSPVDELPRAMRIIAAEGRGAVLLFREPHPKLRLDADDEDGPRTIKRTGTGAQIMSTLGLRELILLTDSPQTKYLGLEAYNLSIVGTRPITKD
jgi:3,4-dihydroxy 2-butanone 4-phosphate synthase/GTP cyclohydrolase II